MTIKCKICNEEYSNRCIRKHCKIKHDIEPEDYYKKYINNINYCPGGHSCNAQGIIKKSEKAYKLYHYKYINPDYHVARYKITADRLSETNKRYGMGLYYIDTPEHIRGCFESERMRVTKVII